MKWAEHFRKEDEFNNMMRDFAKKYIKEHPEYDIMKRSSLSDSESE
jgi:hypothetical protein